MQRAVLLYALLAINLHISGQSSCLIDCHASSCDEEQEPDNFDNRLSELLFSNDTLLIIVQLVDNCAYASEPLYAEAQLVNDTIQLSYSLEPQITDTLYQDGQIIYEFTSPYYECDCCFELTYLLRDIPHRSMPIRLNNQIIYPAIKR
ncbi:hypothetical protein KEM09_19515 [Carboxylicivirga mesophila]|uniref:Uncharacterized protein n=1 Tax=Carboxylicivirga mesophila TaxID=1166478 RepID=A0ABS5KEX9_9BACT|nr:hypothetical protein [Carboxylicivirga mesophila]MBS2213606.1 hypothetical protein [Carboxylicivirga mesophila]